MLKMWYHYSVWRQCMCQDKSHLFLVFVLSCRCFTWKQNVKVSWVTFWSSGSCTEDMILQPPTVHIGQLYGCEIANRNPWHWKDFLFVLTFPEGVYLVHWELRHEILHCWNSVWGLSDSCFVNLEQLQAPVGTLIVWGSCCKVFEALALSTREWK